MSLQNTISKLLQKQRKTNWGTKNLQALTSTLQAVALLYKLSYSPLANLLFDIWLIIWGESVNTCQLKSWLNYLSGIWLFGNPSSRYTRPQTEFPKHVYLYIQYSHLHWPCAMLNSAGILASSWILSLSHWWACRKPMQMPSERNSVIMNAVPLEKSMAPLVPRKVEMLHKQCHAYHFIVVVLGEETLKMILNWT